MNTNKIESMINKKIISHLKDGNKLIDVYCILSDSINKFIERKDYLDVSESYLKSKWNTINSKKKYTTYYVVYTKKRKADLKWLIAKRKIDPGVLGLYSDDHLFGLLLLKDKLSRKDHATS